MPEIRLIQMTKNIEPDWRAKNIGFIGLGLMGAPMIRNLCATGANTYVWNRSSATAKEFAKEQKNITICQTPAQVAMHCDITILMVTDAYAVESVVFGECGVAETCLQNCLVIDMGTTSVIKTRTFAEKLKKMGGYWLDAPVSGGTTAAEDGTLTIMAGGPQDTFHRALPTLQILGDRITHVGEVGAGQIAKSANQMIVGLTIGAVAEAFALARHNGVDPAKIREALFGGFAHSRILELHGERMLTEDFNPRAKCSIQRKDIAEAMELAASVNLHLPGLSTNMKLWDLMIENDWAELDHSALLLAIDPQWNKK